MQPSVFVGLSFIGLGSGCSALDRDVAMAEYRPGTNPVTVVAKRDACYTLHAPESLESHLPRDVEKGERIGFHHSPDGTLFAVVGSEVMPLPEGHYVWRCTPKPVTSWDRFLVRTRDTLETVQVLVGLTMLLVNHPEVGGEL
jgi:hypothetical protein